MDRLRSSLSELKSAVNNPRLFIADYLYAIRNEIDIECEIYLSKAGWRLEEREKALQQLEGMIKEVDLFEKQCLTNVESLQFGPPNLKQLEHNLDSLDLKDGKAISMVERDLDCALIQKHKSLFMKQGLVFLNKSKCKRLEENSGILFGALIIVEDEYLTSNAFQKESE